MSWADGLMGPTPQPNRDQNVRLRRLLHYSQIKNRIWLKFEMFFPRLEAGLVSKFFGILIRKLDSLYDMRRQRPHSQRGAPPGIRTLALLFRASRATLPTQFEMFFTHRNLTRINEQFDVL